MNVLEEEIKAITDSIAMKRKQLEDGTTDNPIQTQGEINLLKLELKERLDKL